MNTDPETEVQRRCDELLAGVEGDVDLRTFFGRQFDLGLAWVHFPEGLGGFGGPPGLQRVVNERIAAAEAPRPDIRHLIGHGMGAPTIATHGSDEQKRRYLRPLFTGEDVWCQLFSEPGAGSDVAGMSTRATRDGDEWVIEGQKVWTSFAHIADFGMLVARTDPTVPKHKGLTYLVVDMHAPGVEVRPIYQLTGDAEFSEVFFKEVRIPDAERLSDVGDGWRVVLTTLMNERVAIGGATPPKGSGFIGELVSLWRRTGGGGGAALDRLMDLWVRAEVLRLTNIRASHLRSVGAPGPEGSIGKVLSAGLDQAITEFAVGLLGAEGTLKDSGYPMARLDHETMWPDPVTAFLRSRAGSIEGGTTQIALNILGERVLGLPPDVRVDKDLPWMDVPRG